jgi:pyruvate dehydrogenase E2 component (dihydrolipoamide acetyltransferase)
MPNAVEVTVPDIGDYENVPVIEVLVADGERVEKDAALIVLESEKATMEVPAPEAGMVRGIRVKVGDKVSKGSVICALEASGKEPGGDGDKRDAVAAENKAAKPEKKVSPSVTKEEQEGRRRQAPESAPVVRSEVSPPDETGPAPPWQAQADRPVPHASPAIRRLAREFGVDLQQIEGTGPKGRITQEDVQDFVKRTLTSVPTPATGAGIPPIPAEDFSKYGEIETKPLARIRKISAQYLHRAWLNIPHVTQTDEADITDLEAFRKSQSQELDVKLTLLPFVMKAAAAALKQFPEFNASLAPDGENLTLKKYCNIGFAADTEHGLVVPVVKGVWTKGIVQLAQECAELASRARDGKLKPDEMKGGCFSISSLGGIGGSHFTPIVNAPEVAILGVSRAVTKPVWNGTEFAPRLMLPLSLSYDHRVIDGAQAARFIVLFGKLLADVRRLAL